MKNISGETKFFIGIILSIVFYLQKASVPHLVEYTFDKNDKLILLTPSKQTHRTIRVIGIAGELFFAAVDLFQNTIQKIIKEPDVKVIIFRLQNIYNVDASICLSILKINDFLKASSRYLLISGVTPEVYDIFQRSGVIKQLGSENVILCSEEKPQESTLKAFNRAKNLINI